MCYYARPISTLWQTSLANQHSSAVLSLLQPVLDASAFTGLFSSGRALWPLEKVGLSNITSTHVHRSHFITAQSRCCNCGLSCASVAQIYITVDGLGEAF